MADSKLTALTALGTPADADILYVVDDPAGTPVSKKVTLADFLSYLLIDDDTFSADSAVYGASQQSIKAYVDGKSRTQGSSTHSSAGVLSVTKTATEQTEVVTVSANITGWTDNLSDGDMLQVFLLGASGTTEYTADLSSLYSSASTNLGTIDILPDSEHELLVQKRGTNLWATLKSWDSGIPNFELFPTAIASGSSITTPVVGSGATPVIETTAVYNGSGGYDHEHSHNLPTGIAADDLILIVATGERASDLNVPSGYTEIVGVLTSSPVNTSGHVFAKKAAGTESGTVTIDFSNASHFGKQTSVVMRISGLPSGWTTASIDAGTTSTASETTLTLNGVTPTGSNSLILRCLMARDFTPTWPSGSTIVASRANESTFLQTNVYSDDDNSTEGSYDITGGTTGDALIGVTLAIPGT